jgi:hypothetical protein
VASSNPAAVASPNAVHLEAALVNRLEMSRSPEQSYPMSRAAQEGSVEGTERAGAGDQDAQAGKDASVLHGAGKG